MRNEDSFDRLIAASERELRDLKTISARPFGLIKFYTKTIQTGLVHSFTVKATFDSDARLPAMMTACQGTEQGSVISRRFNVIDTEPGTMTYSVAGASASSAFNYVVVINSSSPFTTQLETTP